jgi:hypothetical protein
VISPGAKKANGEEIEHLHRAQHTEAVEQPEKTASACCKSVFFHLSYVEFIARTIVTKEIYKVDSLIFLVTHCLHVPKEKVHDDHIISENV